MNQRIQELRTQAAAWVAKNHQPQDPNAYSQKEIDQRYLMYEQKFAELIVREFINEVEGLQVLQSTLDWSQHWNRAIAHTALHLKEHFGVEE